MNDKSHHRGKMPAGGGSSQILCRPPDRADLGCFNRAVKDGSSSPDLLALRDAYLRTGKVPPGVRPVVVESWKRCRKYRLNPNLLPQQIADGRMLAGARQKNQSLLDGAEPLLELVHKKISPTPHVLALADRQGRVLRLFSQHIPDEERAAANLFEGASWHERDIGSNGIGTSLEVGRALVLIGPEHFQNAYANWTAVGVPLKAPDGEIVGALHFSVPNDQVETATWGWILAIAAEIEASLTGGSENGKPQLSSKGDQTFHSLIGIMELFITQLGLSPTHAHFIEDARHALVEIAGERKRNVEELRAEEERYRLVNRATNDVIWDWNLVTGELLWNEALKTTFGYSPDEVPKTLEWWDRVLHPEDRERAVESILAMIADPTKTSWTNEYRMRHADGHWINVLDRGIISRDERGRGVRMIGSMVDLTERVRREEELHLAVQRFETLANMMPQIVWSTRPDGYHDYFNDRWYEFTGMPREKDQGWNWKNYLHPDDVQRSLEVWHRSLMTGQNYEVQYRFRRAADGTYRWFIGRAMPIRDREGKITRWFGTCTDIDDQRREEAKLEALVAERTAELEQQATMLRHLAAELTSAEQRERRRLAALLHDDLQQVLVAARMQISMLGRHVQGEAGARAVGQAQKWIEEAANTARDLSRELRPPVLYEGGLAAALRGLASEMEERHHLKVEIDARDPGEAIADDTKALLFECVRELLFNAAKHAKVEQAKLAMWEDADCLRLSVSDHGCGFNVGTLSGDKRSTGFGLYSIRERLAALGGELKINSQPGSGTQIDLSIPVAQETADQAPASPRPRQRTKQRDPLISNDHRTHILVVDDHAVVREGIAAILGSDERLCVVGQASNGIEAIECAERNQPEVMLMDLNMPYMNGIEATQEILRRWPEMKIIGLSVQDDETTAQAMLNAGATAFLPKAGDSDKMISAILKVITR